ncbi:YmfQ family protein [Pseudomonas asiatica]|uniref:YmfQ family protein n=1 Tax=Pseudomonas asiatica TaxID=2219225 RepID=UPI00244C587D|nr:putative phage tail protein [Pseudomonas asiatica]MDH0132817.1 YmfQ family protein [Pseudomonas asiatica]
MAMTEDDYREGLRGLLPPGPAFDPELQPDVAQLLAGLAPELARVDVALDGLQVEMNPATVNALLVDWEDYLGLPDACTVPGSQTIDQRRQAVLDKLTASGAPQVSYYRRLAKQAGVTVTVEEFRPARVGPTVTGDFLYGDSWSWAWIASAPLAAYGTPEAAAMECRLRLEAPEYTDVEIGYGQAEVASIANHVDRLFNTVHYVMPAAVAGLGD